MARRDETLQTTISRVRSSPEMRRGGSGLTTPTPAPASTTTSGVLQPPLVQVIEVGRLCVTKQQVGVLCPWHAGVVLVCAAANGARDLVRGGVVMPGGRRVDASTRALHQL